MTAQERQEVTLLLELVRAHEEDNKEAHEAILSLVADIEKRLCRKIEELRQVLLKHCDEQDGEIEAATARAIEAATRPSVIHQAGVIVGRGFWRVVVGLALLLGMSSTILLIVERIGSLE